MIDLIFNIKKVRQIFFIILIILLRNNENNLEFFIKKFFQIKTISIIIPIYNNQNYLVDCLNSALNQTLNDIEIICIDDGSKDNSSKILKIFQELDDRVIALKQNNKGAAFSRNRGIKISRGKFISFLDSDDLYYNNEALESLFKNANKNKAIICGGGMRKFQEINNTIIVNDTLFKYEGFIKYIDYQYDFDYQRFIYNRNFLRRNNIYFPPYLRYQDPPFFIKAMTIAKKFYVIQNITHKYRRRYKDLNLKQVMDQFFGFRDCLKYAEKMHLYKLYNKTLNRLNSEIFIKRIEKYRENKILRKIILEIIKVINIKLIKDNKLHFSLSDFYKNLSYKN